MRKQFPQAYELKLLTQGCTAHILNVLAHDLQNDNIKECSVRKKKKKTLTGLLSGTSCWVTRLSAASYYFILFYFYLFIYCYSMCTVGIVCLFGVAQRQAR